MVTEDEVERAIRWMATTDVEFADWKVQMLRAEYLAEVAESLVFKHLEGGVEERKKAAKSSDEVKKAMEEVFATTRGYEKLRAQRKSAELVFNFWQSVNANRRVAGKL